MEITRGKLLSLVVALGYLVFAVVAEGGLTLELLGAAIVLLFPLLLIWFPYEVGSFTGYVGRGGNIDTETHPAIVSFMGWLFLLSPLMAAWWFS